MVWYAVPLQTLALLAAAWLVKLLMPVIDFIGDVACYVGRADFRRDREMEMARIIQSVLGQAPNATVLVVGHSLGSVLVSHSLAHLSAPNRVRRSILITVGSPLVLMSRIFRCIKTPTGLVTDYNKGNLVSFWVNLWRDRDLVGQQLREKGWLIRNSDVRDWRELTWEDVQLKLQKLMKQEGELFDETSLGDGGHGNYWSDPRVWAFIVFMMQAGIEEFRVAIRKREAAELTQSENQELHTNHMVVKGFLNIVIAPIWFLILTVKDTFGTALASSATVPVLAGIRMFWLGAILLAMCGAWRGFREARVALSPANTRIECLGRLRLAKTHLLITMLSLILLMAGYFTLRLWFVRLPFLHSIM